MDHKNIISMTELQKLSLKKLRKMKLPLYVLDKKSKGGGLVIQPLENFSEGALRPNRFPNRSKEMTGMSDYRKLGLLWDRPDLSNRAFHKLIRNYYLEENQWAARRILERCPSLLVKNIYSLDDLKKILQKVKLRPIFQEMWENAVHYWSQNP